MNYKCFPRKKRRDKLTLKCSKIFSKRLQEKDYEGAVLIVFYNVLVNYGKTGILSILYDANSYLKRRERRSVRSKIEEI